MATASLAGRRRRRYPLGVLETPAPPRSSARSPRVPAEAPRIEGVVVDPSVTTAWRVERAALERSEPRAPVRGVLFRSKYVLEGELGRGGMGRVLRAYDRDLKRHVALKVLDARLDDPEVLARFVEEAQISGQLEHPGLLPVHDVGVTDQGDVFFTMKLVRGHVTLRALIQGLRAGDPALHARLPLERRVELLRRLCAALEHAHARGVIHRDVKPENVVLDEAGEVYLLDWGIARLRGELAERARGGAATLEAAAGSRGPGTSYLVGTPLYMAPEQALGEAADARTDVYALATVAYELLTLHHPLEGSPGMPAGALGPAPPAGAAAAAADLRACPTEAAPRDEAPLALGPILEAVRRHVPRDAEAFYDPRNGRVPRVLSRALRRGLAKDPAARLQSAAELDLALARWQTGCGPVVCPGTALQRGMAGYTRWIDRRPLLVPLVTYAGLGLLALSYVALLARHLGG